MVKNNFQVGQRVVVVSANRDIHEEESDEPKRYVYGGDVNNIPIGTHGVVDSVGIALVYVNFEEPVHGNSSWKFNYKELTLGEEISAKTILLAGLKLKKEQEEEKKRRIRIEKEAEERRKQEKKLMKMFKVGQSVILKVPKSDFHIGDKAIIEKINETYIGITGAEKMIGYSGEIRPLDVEIVNLNKILPGNKNRLFIPAKQIEFKIYTLKKQITMINKLKDIESAIIDKNNNICITTKNIIVQYPECEKVNIGKYHFLINNFKDSKLILKSRHYKGGFKWSSDGGSEYYVNHQYFSSISLCDEKVGQFSNNICFGLQQNIANKFINSKDIYRLIKLSIDLLKSKSNDGYMHLETWKDAIKKTTAFDNEISWEDKRW